MGRLLAVCVVVLALGGCAASSSDTYSRQDLGRVIETTPGTVVSSRPVDISGTRSGRGSLAGGATGAVIGATTFSGGGGAVAGVLLGIAGAVVGSLAEELITAESGTEYTIQTEDGRVVTIVQRSEVDRPPISDGTPVRVQWGADYARVIPDARMAPPPSSGGTVPGGTVPGGTMPGGTISGVPQPGGSGGTATGAPPPTGDEWINPDAVPEGAGAPSTTHAGTAPAATGATDGADTLNRRQLRRYGGTVPTGPVPGPPTSF